MKSAIRVLLLCLLCQAVAADELQTIKNQKGTDLSLMKAHDPAAQQKTFRLLPGFQVNLFAAEPMLANPIHMTWDARGRLWVACSWSYPHLRPGEKPNDKIIILEDTDDDGKADKSTVFADGLYIPTGVALSNGGAYVAQTPDVLFLKDTDGDDRADVREIILTGFGIEDSHHSISAWRRGPAGWIYFQEGIFLHSQVETQYGTVRLSDGGVFQYQPLTQRLKVFADVRVGNPWGHMFDRWGQSILIDNPRVHFLSPATANSRAKAALNPIAQTEKQCGGDIISGRHFPPEMMGMVATNRFKSQAVIRYSLADHDSGFSAQLEEPIIKATHPNFRPVDCKMGPDGALYVADWYNPIINHAKHDFRDARRDFSHGRVWRITHKTRPLVKKPKLVGVPLPQLLDNLKQKEYWTRHHTKLVLGEMPADKVVAAVNAWVKTLDPNDADHDHHLLEALWSCQNVNAVNEPLLKQALKAKTGEARAAAVRVIRYWHPELSDPLALLNEAITDEFARVRLEAILSLSFIPDAKAFSVLLRATDRPPDRFIDHAMKLAVDGLRPHWEPAVKAGTLTYYDEAHKDRAMLLGRVNVGKQLKNIGTKRAPTLAQLSEILTRVEAKPTKGDVAQLTALLNAKTPVATETLIRIMGTLERVSRQRKLYPPGSKRLAPYLSPKRPTGLRIAAARLLGACRSPRMPGPLMKLVTSPDEPAALRIAAANAIGEINKKTQGSLVKLTQSKSVDDCYLGVIGVAAIDVKVASGHAAKVFAEPSPDFAVALVDSIIQRTGGSSALSTAMSGSKPHASVAQLVSRHFQVTGQIDEKLIDAFRATATSLAEQLLAEDVKKLMADVEQHGDPARGELVFRRKSAGCTACHAINFAGPALGPDLAAIGAAAQLDYLIDAVLRPNKAIAEEYGAVNVTTIDGMVHTGVLVSRTKDDVVIKDAAQQGAKVTIAADVIEEAKAIPSLMPAGLANQLKSRQEFLDLLNFVSRLGKVGQYQTSVAPVFRRWRLTSIPAIPARRNPASFRDDSAWTPAYSMVDGSLPKSAFGDAKDILLARAHVDVTRDGKVSLKVSQTDGLHLWVDDDAGSIDRTFKLSKGRHAITLVIDSKTLGDSLRVELVADKGSTIRYQIVGGP